MPQVGEVVVVRVTKVLNYGAFCDLAEYDNVAGFVHSSQAASRWVKNIRNFVKENQMRAAKVLSINSEKKQVDLSLNRVSSQAEKERIQQWKQFKRQKKLLEVLAKRTKKSFDLVWDEIAEPLISEYGSLNDAFRAISIEGEKAAKNINSKWLKDLIAIVKENVTVPQKTIKGVLSLQSFKSNGVETVKKVLKDALTAGKEAKVEIYYLGSGTYMVKVTAFDYKTSERILKNVIDTALESIKVSGGKGSFERSN